jgi:hypothetical protein
VPARTLRGLLVALVVALTAAGCATGHPEMSADDAREFTQRALEETGMRGIRVSLEVEEDLFRQSDPPVEVWRTEAEVHGGWVAFAVEREGDRAVFVNDVADDGSELFTDEQFATLESFRFNAAAERSADRRTVPAAIAGLLAVVALGALIAALATDRVGLRAPAPVVPSPIRPAGRS